MSVIGNGKVFGQAWTNVFGQFNWKMNSDMVVNDHALQPLSFSATDSYSPPSETDIMCADLTANCGGGSRSITRTPNMIEMSGNRDDGVKADPLDAVRDLLNRVVAGKCSREDAKAELERICRACTPEDNDRIRTYALDRADQEFALQSKIELAELGIFGLEADAFCASAAARSEGTPEDRARFNEMWKGAMQQKHSPFHQIIAELTALNMREVPDVGALRKLLSKLSIDAILLGLGEESLLAAADVLREVTISRDRLHSEFVIAYISIYGNFGKDTIERELKTTESLMASANLSKRSMEALQQVLDLLKAKASG